MKKLKFGVCMLLAAAICCPLATACSGGDKNTIKDTTYDFVKEGKSDYKIVVPAKAGDNVLLASTELQSFILEASGASLPIVKDTEAGYSETAKLLSVGDTSFLKQATGLEPKVEDLNTDGYYIKTAGQSVFMAGATEEGSLYAAYFFLENTFGYRFYAPDESVFSQAENRKLPLFDVKDVPDFAHRNCYWKSYKDNAKVRGRFRSLNNDQWGLFAHSYFMLLPPETYRGAHPDWYFPRGENSKTTQLCLTAPGLEEELVANLKKFILQKNDSRYFMVGQEDTNSACTCQSCSASNETNGGISGTTMVFVNRVARDIKAWQQTDEWKNSENPNRQIWIGTFAYQKTRVPPVVEKNGEYVPANTAVVAEDNVLVQFAPLEACYSHSLYDECNKSMKNSIEGWKSVTKNFAIWSYSTVFTNYFLHFNNFSSIQEDYRIYKEMGTQVMMDQGTGETASSPLHDLRAYIQSQLMWDVDRDVNKLIDDFMRGFYKDAYKPMRDYFDMIRMHYATLDAESRATINKPFDSHVYNIYSNNNEQVKYWPKQFILQVMNKLNEALSKVAAVPDAQLREKLRLRVVSETLSMRFLLIEYYIGDYTPAEQKQMIDSFANDCGEVGVVCWKENTPVQEKLAAWREQLKD